MQDSEHYLPFPSTITIARMFSRHNARKHPVNMGCKKRGKSVHCKPKPTESVSLNAFKQPKAFYLIFSIELWERFGYYGLQGIMAVYG